MSINRQRFPSEGQARAPRAPSSGIALAAAITLAVIMALAVIALSTTSCRGGGGRSGPVDPHARELADAMARGLGGERAWKKMPFLRFDFVELAGGREVARRTHLWDRVHGRYRLETEVEGKPFLALFSLTENQGAVFSLMQEVPPGRLGAELARARALRAADLFWIESPFWLLRKDVMLAYLGETMTAGRLCPTVAAYFQKLPVPSGDRRCTYHIDTRNDRPLALSMIDPQRAGARAAAPGAAAADSGRTTLWVVQDWTEAQGCAFPTRIIAQGDRTGRRREIRIENLAAPELIRNAVFQAP